MLQSWLCSWQALEAGQFFEGHIDLNHRAVRLKLLNTFEKPFIQSCICTELQKRAFRIGIGENGAGPQFFSVPQPYSLSLSVMHKDFLHRAICAYHYTVRLC